ASPSPAETPEPVEPETGPSLPEMAHPEAPAEIEVLSEETGAQPLARYATSGESLPRVFVLRDVEPPSGVEGLAPNALLDSVARVLREQPRLHVRIEGHTPPSKGTRAARQLSEQWAEAVKAYLVERGVEAERVEALGRGSAEPIDTNEMPEGRARNRRIQLVVIGR
ncbi:MAG TPA: OmpA family protein, partial [Polyangiaceae bacterium]